jgi:predicted phosphodiesterase
VRTAVVSDIHGNSVALEALVGDLERDPVDQVICLGDVAQGGPQPAEVIDRLQELGWAIVLGNADAFLLDPDASREPTTPALLETRAWSVEQLGPERLDVIRGFRPTIGVELGGGHTLLAFHGSPGDYDDVMLPSLPEEEFRAFVEGHDASVLAGGHVHLQYLRRLGSSLFVNPGSVGLGYDHEQPREAFTFDPWASYAVVATEEGTLEVSFRRVAFDPREVMRAIQESGMPIDEERLDGWRNSLEGP